MRTSEKVAKVVAVAILVAAIVLAVVSCTPSGRAFLNQWDYAVRKVDDATSYETRKQVEDTCRAYIVSYEADKLTWQQYKASDNSEHLSWADSAKLRANKAALTYNEFFLKNSFVFEGNVPSDIRTELPLLE